MTVLLLFAFASGVVTILSPCILPVLPIVLSGGVSGGRARPFGVLTGFVVSFTVFTLALSAIVRVAGISADALRLAAVALLVGLGLVMVVPALRDRFELAASRLANIGSGRRGRLAGAAGKAPRSGFWGGVPVGLSLGLVWTPCVGPIMASVIGLALTQRIDGGSVLITLAYSLGTSLPMLAVMFGGRALIARVPALSRNTPGIQKAFGALMILIGIAVGLGWDRRFQSAVLAAFPGYGAGLTAIENAAPVRTALQTRESAAARGAASGGAAAGGAAGVFAAPPYAAPEDGTLGDYGLAPPLVTRGLWFNTQAIAPATGLPAGGGSLPLTMEQLRGKVVVVDFWTYSCVNCVRTLPYLRAWYEAYGSRGLVVIGVHTPEFEFEKSPANLSRAIRELGVRWPVVQDNDYEQWNAYSNQYWPAHYFIDANGRVRYFHFGEGDYDVSERVIQALLREAGASVAGIVSRPPPSIDAQTPETYLGYDRTTGFTSAVRLVPDAAADYRPGRAPGNGEWTLDGRWAITPQYAVPESEGTLQLGFDAKNVFLVIEPQGPGGSIEVTVDGRPGADTTDVRKGALVPRESRMYQLVGLPKRGAHVLRLAVKGKLRLFAFTFG